jgi:hypothetical protein
VTASEEKLCSMELIITGDQSQCRIPTTIIIFSLKTFPNMESASAGAKKFWQELSFSSHLKTNHAK